MKTESRTLQLERRLRKVECPRCKARRVVQKQPRNYKLVRCMNCGFLAKLKKRK